MLAALLFALYLNLNAQATRRLPAVALVSLQQGLVGVVTLTVSAFVEVWQLGTTQPLLSLWGWVAASILISTCGRFVLQSWAQSRTTTGNAALLLTLEPVWVAVLAMLWLGQGMSGLQALGCLLIFAAVLLSRSVAVLGWWRQRRWRSAAVKQPL
ncbi:MAG: DMT family transporter [Thiolinea sp.]